MNHMDISTDTAQFYFICTLITIVGGLVTYIHKQVVDQISESRSDIKKMADKLDKYEDIQQKNQLMIETAILRLGNKVDSMQVDIATSKVQNAKEHVQVQQSISELNDKIEELNSKLNKLEDEFRYYTNGTGL